VTRGEALDLLLKGHKLNATHQGAKVEIWIVKDCLMVQSQNVTGGWNLGYLLTMTDFEPVPESDTAEKILRDWVSWESSGETVGLIQILDRAKALIAQMDGDK